MTSLVIIVIGFFVLLVKPKFALCIMIAGLTYGILSGTPYAVLGALIVAAILRIALMFFKVK